MRKHAIALLPLGLVVIIMIVPACTDHGLAPIREGISGRITYVGAWPDTTEWVRVAVFRKMPASVFEIALNPPVFSDTLPRFVSTYDYTLTLAPGTYEWVVLAWKPRKKFASSDYSGLDTLGVYSRDGSFTAPASVTVPGKKMLTGVDIIADFARLSPPSPILP
ncbi:MAG: hypothetical protein ONB48_01470 [candidate division KSB1 bacterium]|nr:hypothetical protein [candidate division KSB1 bacterium]MDZ7272654.1 hypothetical protein [candidate division KSB1 bacterium]MDZ7284324.1 hypothetical protein [candidate division KSB1 bacterium]MDZ7297280.1 hypothetical protein [candidate division KSB1 bacterium]MDZ7309399.1 hypothetical protein [candidate division KSB1 bacterium]